MFSEYFEEIILNKKAQSGDEMSLVRAFEVRLDQELAKRKIYATDANEGLALLSNMFEHASSERLPHAEHINRGQIIFASHLVSGTKGRSADIRSTLDDVFFGSHYYMLREFLYYTYNSPGSIGWKFTDKEIKIRFIDRTIPRQFFTVHNDTLLGSFDVFKDFDLSEQIECLLKGQQEGVLTENVELAASLIKREVDIKLSAYFSILPIDSNIDLGGYTYAQFLTIYRALMVKALYHRYMARINGYVGAIFILPQELIQDAVDDDEVISFEVVEKIINDLVYESVSGKNSDASYFSLFREGGGERKIVMRSHHFAITEGIVKLLRVVALRRPNHYLAQVSNPIGTNFVKRIKAAFEDQGFSCRSEVLLRNISPELPDIDLLVVSEEPTLGFVVYICEIKSPIPPIWAKDQLKVLNKDGVSKAFRQVEVVGNFLRTESGLNFLRSMLPKNSSAHQSFNGYVVALDYLIITSDNAGMFFGDESTKIINFRTLERLLLRSDGDIEFIMHVLSNYNKNADKTLKTKMIDFKLGKQSISYEVVTLSPILDFPQQEWRNSTRRQNMIDDFVAGGGHPFDVLDLNNRG